ncbi:VanZ family protein [Arthrobacter sp. ATA002]|uniref:VanZ family protein n=1 Tax=Arthrobacter sp. ATA002 TaxID=2991715 RepID=UPI0022A75AB6|nr:VanZ family protein [Arthrobacter sp. ATA002]WAP51144.1 VanZ family protein [Arthrobacter sp. ATA002]
MSAGPPPPPPAAPRTPQTPQPPPTHPSRRVRQRRTLALLFFLYIGAVALIVFWPSPVDQNSAGTLRAILGRLHGAGVPGWINYDFVENIANVVMFLPFGVLAAAWLDRERAWLAAVAGIAASCAIETAQAVLLPNRVATIYDVTANSLGAALGCVAVYAWRTRTRRNTQA